MVQFGGCSQFATSSIPSSNPSSPSSQQEAESVVFVPCGRTDTRPSTPTTAVEPPTLCPPRFKKFYAKTLLGVYEYYLSRGSLPREVCDGDEAKEEEEKDAAKEEEEDNVAKEEDDGDAAEEEHDSRKAEHEDNNVNDDEVATIAGTSVPSIGTSNRSIIHMNASYDALNSPCSSSMPGSSMFEPSPAPLPTEVMPSSTPQKPRIHPIPGIITSVLREIGWKTPEKLQERYLPIDWEEFETYQTWRREYNSDVEASFEEYKNKLYSYLQAQSPDGTVDIPQYYSLVETRSKEVLRFGLNGEGEFGPPYEVDFVSYPRRVKLSPEEPQPVPPVRWIEEWDEVGIGRPPCDNITRWYLEYHTPDMDAWFLEYDEVERRTNDVEGGDGDDGEEREQRGLDWESKRFEDGFDPLLFVEDEVDSDVATDTATPSSTPSGSRAELCRTDTVLYIARPPVPRNLALLPRPRGQVAWRTEAWVSPLRYAGSLKDDAPPVLTTNGSPDCTSPAADPECSTTTEVVASTNAVIGELPRSLAQGDLMMLMDEGAPDPRPTPPLTTNTRGKRKERYWEVEEAFASDAEGQEVAGIDDEEEEVPRRAKRLREQKTETEIHSY
ncbi:hypothetical protein V5O48_015028 [Marasmius crinis-equi]|uniref:Uncharacterized protein n=1 Tax=Marasmius crinis-equi TaxID=585013 RepID=A0ABR3EVN1_9AGAR